MIAEIQQQQQQQQQQISLGAPQQSIASEKLFK